MQKPFTVVLEFNCHHPETKASVWLIPGKRDVLAGGADELGQLPGSVALIGPVSQELGVSAFERLCEFLKTVGVEFESDVVADD